MRRVSGVFILILGLLSRFHAVNSGKSRKPRLARKVRGLVWPTTPKRTTTETSILFEQILPIVRGLPEAEKCSSIWRTASTTKKCTALSRTIQIILRNVWPRYAFGRSPLHVRIFPLQIFSPDQPRPVWKHSGNDVHAGFLNRFPNSKFKGSIDWSDLYRATEAGAERFWQRISIRKNAPIQGRYRCDG